MSAEDKRAFGESAKVGDMACVVVRGGWNNRIARVERGPIERLTATHVVALVGRRFARKDGAEIGGDNYFVPKLQPFTPEIAAEAAVAAEMNRAEDVCYKAAHALSALRGRDAIRVAALLPDELKGGAK